ncbi:two pore domain potassium channel family protein [Mycolicibacterium arabiense]|nr:two pore domain potassium channel family protein [Mycolicibacterium arabiense]
MDGQTRLTRYERRMEWPLAAIALVFLAVYSVRVLEQPSGTAGRLIEVTWIVTWGVFGVDFLIRLCLARPRMRWFARHLPELAILLLPALRPLRLLTLAVVVNVLQRAIGRTVRGRVIVYTAFGAAVIVYGGALAMLDVERYAPDSKITDFGTALWWSFTTVTTVGYGDTYPTSGGGRLVAVALMVAGVSLLGVVTATLASWIVERVAEEDSAQKAATAAQLEELRREIRELLDSNHRQAPRAYGESDGRGRTNSTEGSGGA